MEKFRTSQKHVDQLKCLKISYCTNYFILPKIYDPYLCYSILYFHLQFNMLLSYKKSFHSLAVCQLASLKFFSASVLTTAHVSIVEIIKWNLVLPVAFNTVQWLDGRLVGWLDNSCRCCCDSCAFTDNSMLMGKS